MYMTWLVSAIANLRKATISFIMSACNNSPPTGRIFMEFDSWVFFERLSRKIQVPLKSDKNSRYFAWRPTCIFIISPLVIFRMRNVSDTSCKEKQNTHFMCVTFFFFRKCCHLRGNVERYSRAGQPRDDNMAHTHSMLYSWGCKHTLSEWVVLTAFQLQRGCTNMPQCDVLLTLPVLFNSIHVLDFSFNFWKSQFTSNQPLSLANLGSRQNVWYHRVYKLLFFLLKIWWEGYCAVHPTYSGCTPLITSVRSCYVFTYIRLIPVILLFPKLVAKETDVTSKRQYFCYRLC